MKEKIRVGSIIFFWMNSLFHGIQLQLPSAGRSIEEVAILFPCIRLCKTSRILVNLTNDGRKTFYLGFD